MGLISNVVALLPLLLLLVSNSKAQPAAAQPSAQPAQPAGGAGGVFDITKYGAKPNADITAVRILALVGREILIYTTF